MDAARLDALLARRAVTKAQHAALARWIDRIGTDPVAAGAPPSVCRLWFEHCVTTRGTRYAPVKDVHDLILKHVGSAAHHKSLASKLGQACFLASQALSDYLSAWSVVTSDLTLLEAVVWIWLYNCGHAPDDPPCVDDHGAVVSVDDARTDPSKLIHVLTQFKMQFQLRTVHPARAVDALALQHGWWALDDTARSDTLIFASVCERMEEHEWVPTEHVAECARQLDVDDVASVLSRMDATGHVRTIRDGVTLPHIFAISRRVRTLVAVMATAPGTPWLGAPPDVTGLTDEQAVVVVRAVEGVRILLVCAPAGTGKTYTAARLAAAVPDGGRVLCLAPTHKALAVLRGKFGGVVGVTFMTVHRFVATEQHCGSEWALVLVDEVSMVTMAQLRTVFEAGGHDESQTRFVLMGDDAQLPCIGRGLPIRDLQEVLPVVRLTRCMRTEGVGLLRLATRVRDGGHLDAAWLSEVGTEEVHLHECVDVLAATVALVADGCDGVRPPWDPAYVQVVTPQNAHVKEINEAVQAHLHRGATKREVFSGCYVGDAVRVVVNTDEYKNGDEGMLEALVHATQAKGKRKKGGEDRKAVVRRADGSCVHVALWHLVPAYASTVHKVQGSEYGRVVLAMFPRVHPNLRSRELIYTSVTRARHHLHLVGALCMVTNMVARPRRTVFAYV